MPKKETKELGKEIADAISKPTKEMLAVIKEMNKTTEDKMGDLSKRQEGFLKGFVKKESPLLNKTFKFFQEGKKREKVRAMLQAKTMGPVMVKGLSLGLLKFGIGGAIGASKIFDMTNDFQSYVKEEDAKKREGMLNLIDEMRDGESPKSMDEIEKVLKKQGVKGLELSETMKDYQDVLDGRMKEVITEGVNSGTKTADILKQLVDKKLLDKKDIKEQELLKQKIAKTKKSMIPTSKTEEKTSATIDKLTNITGGIGEEHGVKLIEIAQAIDKNKLEIVNVQDYLNLMVDVQQDGNKIALDREDTDKKRFELEKQVEQNNQLRHLDMMDKEDEKGDKGGVFGGLLGSFKNLRGTFGKAVGLLSTVGGTMATMTTALLPVLAVAGTALLAFKAGGAISKGLDGLTSWATGKEGETLGGWLQEAISGKSEDKKISQDKFFATEGGRQVLKSAKKAGFEVGGQTTVGELMKFQEEQKLSVKRKPSLQKEIAQAEQAKVRAEKEMKTTEKSSDAEAIIQAIQEMNINVAGVSGGSKLDTIPSNSDDLQLAYMTKGGAS